MSLEQSAKEKGNVASIVNRFSKMDVQLRKGFPNQQSQRSVVVCFSYAAQMDDELDLKEGDELEVVEYVEEGWARGEIKKSTLNPAAHGKIGLFPTNFVTFGGSATTTNTRSKKEMARVLYKYDAANPDELSLPEGALITVLNKNCEDEGWYEGEHNGKRGLFPENFVKLLEPVSVNDKPLLAIGAIIPSQPPSLPAKPTKNGLPALDRISAPNPPIASTRETSSFISNNGLVLNDLALSSSGINLTSVQNNLLLSKVAQDDRKSVIAGLQSKLFPSGKLPPAPHKSTTVSGGHNSSPTDSANGQGSDYDDINHLFSLTKNRPKQTNKRPPSLSIRSSSQSKYAIDNSPLASSPQPSTVGSANLSTKADAPAPQFSKTMIQLPTKPKHFSFSSPPNDSNTITTGSAHLTIPTHKLTTTFALQLSAAPVTSISSAAALLACTNDYVSRQEFDSFCLESNKKIEELARQVAELFLVVNSNK